MASKLAKLINNRGVIMAITAIIAVKFGVHAHPLGDGLWDGH